MNLFSSGILVMMRYRYKRGSPILQEPEPAKAPCTGSKYCKRIIRHICTHSRAGSTASTTSKLHTGWPGEVLPQVAQVGESGWMAGWRFPERERKNGGGLGLGGGGIGGNGGWCPERGWDYWHAGS